MNRRFLQLAADVRKSFNVNKALTVNQAADRGQFDFPTSPEKVAAFERWLRRQIDAGILEISPRVSGTHWQNPFIRAAYLRSVHDTDVVLERSGELLVPTTEAVIQTGAHAETLKLMYSRVFEGLRGITEAMSSQLSQIFSQALIEGVGPRVIAKRITDEINSISRKRAMVMARTETIRVYSEAKLNVLEANEIQGVTADVEILTAGDNNVCQKCKDLIGKVFTIKQARGRIPVHPRCLPGDAVITSSPRVSAVFKRWYNGDMIIVRTASGKNLTCTPNHPILTSKGWIAAKFLDTSNKIICCINGDREMIRVADSDYMPARIEDIAESFFSSSKVVSREMPISSEDFYGDGVGSDVYVVGAYIELPLDSDSSLLHEFSEFEFDMRDAGLIDKSGIGDLTSLLDRYTSSFSGSMSSSDLFFPLFDTHTFPFKGFSLRFVPPRNPIIHEPLPYDLSRYFTPISEGFFGPSLLVELDNEFVRDDNRSGVSNLNSMFPENPSDNIPRDPYFVSDMLSRGTGLVYPDDVISVDVCDFSGHVYDLQTEDEYFVANSIAVSNCRCTWNQVNIKAVQNAA